MIKVKQRKSPHHIQNCEFKKIFPNLWEKKRFVPIPSSKRIPLKKLLFSLLLPIFGKLLERPFSNTLMRIFFVNSNQLIRYNLTYTVLSKILYTFPSKAHILYLFEAPFEKFDSGTLQFSPYCP